MGEVPLTRREERLLELVATVILALATLGTAWSGYQATRWSGVQAADYVTGLGVAGGGHEGLDERRARTASSTRRCSASGSMPTTPPTRSWRRSTSGASARSSDRPSTPGWPAIPSRTAEAPPGPLYMPEYVSADAQRSAELEAQAAAMFEAGQQANETSDQYVLNTVFLASALFLAGIAGRFEWRAARIAILVTSAIALGLGLFNIIRLPVE